MPEHYFTVRGNGYRISVGPIALVHSSYTPRGPSGRLVPPTRKPLDWKEKLAASVEELENTAKARPLLTYLPDGSVVSYNKGNKKPKRVEIYHTINDYDLVERVIRLWIERS